MDQFLNLLYVFFNGDFFVVIIVALILILTVVLIGLIKVQRENERLMEESNALKENVVKEVEEDTKEKEEVLLEANVEKTINESLSKEEPAKEEVVEAVNEVVEEVKEEIEKPLEEFSEIKEEKPEVDVINPIEAYELDEEANAVISTKELESIEKERNELYGTENNAKLIEEYETDQENKAIISYAELLKNAQGLELEYIEKPKEDDNAPVVKQVELKDQPFKGVNYKAEEEYLKILKEFRNDLIANG